MAWLKRVTLFVLLVVMFVLGVVISVENDAPTALVIWGLSLPALGVGFWLCIVFFLGVVMGVVFHCLSALSFARKVKN